MDRLAEPYIKRLPSIDTLADLIERQIILINRLAFYEQAKRDESAKDEPDFVKIARLDKASRDCNEYRSEIRNRVNKVLEEIRENKYESLNENRTFSPASVHLCDIIDRQAEAVSRNIWHKNMVEVLEKELGIV